MKRLVSYLLAAFIAQAQSALAAEATAIPPVAGTYVAVTESEWALELTLASDGGATYTVSSWEAGKSSTTTQGSSTKGRWVLEGNVLTVSLMGDSAGKSVVYTITECLPYKTFGMQGCSFGLKPASNSASRAFSQPVWNKATFRVPGAA